MIVNHFSAYFAEGLAFNTVHASVSAITYYHRVLVEGILVSNRSRHTQMYKPSFVIDHVIDHVLARDLPTVLDALKCSP